MKDVAPLRKVVRYEERIRGIYGSTRTWEVLECGHRQIPKKDKFGHLTKPLRRRCRRCLKNEKNRRNKLDEENQLKLF